MVSLKRTYKRIKGAVRKGKSLYRKGKKAYHTGKKVIKTGKKIYKEGKAAVNTPAAKKFRRTTGGVIKSRKKAGFTSNMGMGGFN